MEYNISLEQFVNKVNENAKRVVIDEISKFIEDKCHEYLRFKDNCKISNDVIIKSLCYDRHNGLTFEGALTTCPNGVFEKKVSELPLNIIENITKLMATSTKPYYNWVGESDDKSYYDDDCRVFESEIDAYNDMRNAALEKMKWNTNYDEDFYDVEDGDYLGYEVKFFKNKIIHTSYSGTYTYKIVKIG